MSFFGGLRRRNVFKVAVAYAVVGWLLIEISSVLGPALRLPEWTTTLVAFLLILGFPVAIVLSWAYETTPTGVKRSGGVPSAESTTRVSRRKLDLVIIGALVIALGLVVYSYEFSDTVGVPVGTVDPTESTDAPVPVEDRSAMPDSVAVLPFDNLSPDPDNAYFAAGMHEEILNQLVKIRNLSVISRTSVLVYEESDLTIPEIAEELNVETIMEGSVRYAGNRVRITAQLIDAQTDEHLWSEVYEENLEDVFGIQADVAMNIANALEVAFSPAEQAAIESIPTQSPEAYSYYLRANSEQDLSYSQVIGYLDQAIELDPNFAAAYVLRAWFNISALIGLTPSENPTELARMATQDAEMALSIDSSLGFAHATLALVHMADWRGAEAESEFARAYDLYPDSGLLTEYARFKRYRGEYASAVELARNAVDLDPNLGYAADQLGQAYRFSQDLDSAASAFRRGVDLAPLCGACVLQLAQVEASRGNDEEAIRSLELAESLIGLGGINAFRMSQFALAYSQANRPDEAQLWFDRFVEEAEINPVGDSVWARAYLALGQYENVLDRLHAGLESRQSTDLVALTEFAANPWSDPMLEGPEYQAVFDQLWDDL